MGQLGFIYVGQSGLLIFLTRLDMTVASSDGSGSAVASFTGTPNTGLVFNNRQTTITNQVGTVSLDTDDDFQLAASAQSLTPHSRTAFSFINVTQTIEVQSDGNTSVALSSQIDVVSPFEEIFGNPVQRGGGAQFTYEFRRASDNALLSRKIHRFSSSNMPVDTYSDSYSDTLTPSDGSG